MARAKTKAELLKSAQERYEKLISLIDTIDIDKQKGLFTFDVTNEKEMHWRRDKNIRDVLMHLYEWHQLLINWVHANTNGEEKQFLLEGYNWKTYGEMNVKFWEKHQNTPYEDSRKMLEKSHNEVILLIERLSDEELFLKGSFEWVGGSTLGQYCVSATSSHYDWAMKKIKKHISTFK
jgi:Uncharacterized conserved protein